ncbi:MAG: AMP-binding protein, partial [Rhodoblastus sp.]|nr:AMP-binding protein [Rhodoblastus sp.]
GAKLFITSKAKAGEAEKLAPKISDLKLFSLDSAWGLYASFEEARAKMPATPIADEAPGVDMLYSSGTTGRPKGVRTELKDEPIDAANSLVQLAAGLFGFTKDTVYLSPAPLYHAAPLRWCMTTMRLGG